MFQKVGRLNDTTKTAMVEYITARTTTNGARAQHLTMERGLQIADLSQRLDGSSREKTGVRSSRMAMAGSALSHPQPPIYPLYTHPTPNLCPHSHPDALPPAYLLSPLLIHCSGFVLCCWIQAGRGEAGADPCRWDNPLLLCSVLDGSPKSQL